MKEVPSETFENKENWVRIIELLSLDDSETGRKLTNDEKRERKALLKPYEKMGDTFRGYILRHVRENMQRLVIKLAKLTD